MGLLSLTRQVGRFLRKGLDKIIGLQVRDAPTPRSFDAPIRQRDALLIPTEVQQVSGLIFESQQAARYMNQSKPDIFLPTEIIPVNPVLIDHLPGGDRFVYYLDLVLGTNQYTQSNRYLQQLSSPTQLSKEELEYEMRRITELMKNHYKDLRTNEEKDEELFDQINMLFIQAAY